MGRLGRRAGLEARLAQTRFFPTLWHAASAYVVEVDIASTPTERVGGAPAV